MSKQPRMLIVSFSTIAKDPRVIKQVRYFSERYAVTTCGFGPRPEGVVDHIEIPLTHTNKLDGRIITSKIYLAALWAQRGMRWVRKALKGRHFEVALANDIEAVPVALSARPTHGVHADMHEYFPRWREDNELWRRRISPYYEYLCKRYLPRAGSVTTVCDGIAREYEKLGNMTVDVVTNATPYHDLSPTPVDRPLKVVHSGGALARRHMELMIEAAGRLPDKLTFDLYLVKSDPKHFDELVALAGTTTNVRVLGPVPYEDLISTLNGYDLGIYVLPPNGFNHLHALPNKIFDYVQARLGIMVGPSPEMAAVVRDHELGVVSDGFEVDDIEATLAAVTAEDVERWKQASHAVARELSAESEIEGWARAIDRLLAS
ncbi:MAG: hypothetical protein ACTHW7_13535 [Actinomycetaceae bacterium]